MPAAAELGVGFVPYSPLGRGFLTGALTPERVAGGILRAEARFTEHRDANERLVTVVREVARELAATPAQVALAWLFEQGRVHGLSVVPIPGTRRAERVAENVGAVGLELAAGHLARLDDALALVEGSRGLSFSPPGWISADREV